MKFPNAFWHGIMAGLARARGGLLGRARRGPDDEQRRGGWFLVTVGGMSSWCGRHWPVVLRGADSLVCLAHCLTKSRPPRQGRSPSHP